jgi:hypothetical protein
MLQSSLQAVAEATGWVLFVSAAGLNPSDEGHMYMDRRAEFSDCEMQLMTKLTRFYFGPLSPMGYNFEISYEGFVEGFQKPFVKHAKQCFRELSSVPYNVDSIVLTIL